MVVLSMLQEVLLALLGFTGDVIVPVEVTQTSRNSGRSRSSTVGFEVNPVLHHEMTAGERISINTVVQLGYYFQRLKAFVQQQPHTEQSLYMQALRDSLQDDVLQPYAETIAQVEQMALQTRANQHYNNQQQSLTLVHLQILLSDYFQIFPACLSLIEGVPVSSQHLQDAQQQYRGCALLQLLHHRMISSSVDSVNRVYHLLSRSLLSVMFAQISDWICEGRLNDPNNEFFIVYNRCINNTDELEEEEETATTTTATAADAATDALAMQLKRLGSAQHNSNNVNSKPVQWSWDNDFLLNDGNSRNNSEHSNNSSSMLPDAYITPRIAQNLLFCGKAVYALTQAAATNAATSTNGAAAHYYGSSIRNRITVPVVYEECALFAASLQAMHHNSDDDHNNSNNSSHRTNYNSHNSHQQRHLDSLVMALRESLTVRLHVLLIDEQQLSHYLHTFKQHFLLGEGMHYNHVTEQLLTMTTAATSAVTATAAATSAHGNSSSGSSKSISAATAAATTNKQNRELHNMCWLPATAAVNNSDSSSGNPNNIFISGSDSHSRNIFNNSSNSSSNSTREPPNVFKHLRLVVEQTSFSYKHIATTDISNYTKAADSNNSSNTAADHGLLVMCGDARFITTHYSGNSNSNNKIIHGHVQLIGEPPQQSLQQQQQQQQQYQQRQQLLLMQQQDPTQEPQQHQQQQQQGTLWFGRRQSILEGFTTTIVMSTENSGNNSSNSNDSNYPHSSQGDRCGFVMCLQNQNSTVLLSNNNSSSYSSSNDETHHGDNINSSNTATSLVSSASVLNGVTIEFMLLPLQEQQQQQQQQPHHDYRVSLFQHNVNENFNRDKDNSHCSNNICLGTAIVSVAGSNSNALLFDGEQHSVVIHQSNTDTPTLTVSIHNHSESNKSSDSVLLLTVKAQLRNLLQSDSGRCYVGIAAVVSTTATAATTTAQQQQHHEQQQAINVYQWLFHEHSNSSSHHMSLCLSYNKQRMSNLLLFVFTDHVFEQYNSLFRVLLLTSVVAAELNNCWKTTTSHKRNGQSTNSGGSSSSSAKPSQRLLLLRRHMQHFVEVFQRHCQFDVIEVQYAHLQSSIASTSISTESDGSDYSSSNNSNSQDKHQDFEAIMNAHSRYLSNMLTMCCVRDRLVGTLLTELLLLCRQLCAAVNIHHNNDNSGNNSNSSGGSSSSHSNKQIRDFTARVEAIHSEWDTKVSFFVSIITRQSSHSSSSYTSSSSTSATALLGQLAMKLDYNVYYAERQAAVAVATATATASNTAAAEKRQRQLLQQQQQQAMSFAAGPASTVRASTPLYQQQLQQQPPLQYTQQQQPATMAAASAVYTPASSTVFRPYTSQERAPTPTAAAMAAARAATTLIAPAGQQQRAAHTPVALAPAASIDDDPMFSPVKR